MTTDLKGLAFVFVGLYFHFITDEAIRLRASGVSADEIERQEDRILEAARVDARARMRAMGFTRQVVRQAERDAEKGIGAMLKGGMRP